MFGVDVVRDQNFIFVSFLQHGPESLDAVRITRHVQVIGKRVIGNLQTKEVELAKSS